MKPNFKLTHFDAFLVAAWLLVCLVLTGLAYAGVFFTNHPELKLIGM
jgi:hypothetical protein